MALTAIEFLNRDYRRAIDHGIRPRGMTVSRGLFQAFEEELTPNGRFVMNNIGVRNLSFRGIPVTIGNNNLEWEVLRYTIELGGHRQPEPPEESVTDVIFD